MSLKDRPCSFCAHPTQLTWVYEANAAAEPVCQLCNHDAIAEGERRRGRLPLGPTVAATDAVMRKMYPVVPAMTGDVCGPNAIFGLDRTAPQPTFTLDEVKTYVAEIAAASEQVRRGHALSGGPAVAPPLTPWDGETYGDDHRRSLDVTDYQRAAVASQMRANKLSDECGSLSRKLDDAERELVAVNAECMRLTRALAKAEKKR